MDDKRDYSDEEIQYGLEELFKTLKQAPEQRLTILNAPRYAEVMRSVKQITEYIKDDCPDAKISIRIDELTSTTLCLTIIADEFNVYNIESFCKMIKPANTMDVIPRLDQTVEIGFTFDDVRRIAPPTK